MTPHDRRQECLLPGRAHALSGPQQPEAIIESRHDIVWCQHRDLGRRELDRQWDAVEAAPDLRHGKACPATQREAGLGGAWSADEKLPGFGLTRGIRSRTLAIAAAKPKH